MLKLLITLCHSYLMLQQDAMPHEPAHEFNTFLQAMETIVACLQQTSLKETLTSARTQVLLCFSLNTKRLQNRSYQDLPQLIYGLLTSAFFLAFPLKTSTDFLTKFQTASYLCIKYKLLLPWYLQSLHQWMTRNQ